MCTYMYICVWDISRLPNQLHPPCSTVMGGREDASTTESYDRMTCLTVELMEERMVEATLSKRMVSSTSYVIVHASVMAESPSSRRVIVSRRGRQSASSPYLDAACDSCTHHAAIPIACLLDTNSEKKFCVQIVCILGNGDLYMSALSRQTFLLSQRSLPSNHTSRMTLAFLVMKKSIAVSDAPKIN